MAMSETEPVAGGSLRGRVAWILIVVVDLGFVAWGGMAALFPEYLLGPGSAPILRAGYEGFTGSSWLQLDVVAPGATGFMTVLFRVYGAYNVGFGLLAIAVTIYAFRRGERWAWWALLVTHTITLGAAMTYDRVVHAIGPFEMSEYLGLALVYGALAVTAARTEA
jgi:hypothetical protein